MLPNLSDTVLTVILGTIVLQVASVALILVLALNIALGSFNSLMLLHNIGKRPREELLRVTMQAGMVVALLYLLMSGVAYLHFDGIVGEQSSLFLLLSAARPFLFAIGAYSREALVFEKKHDVLHKVTTRAALIYILLNSTIVLSAKFYEWPYSATFLLIGVYAAQILATALFYKNVSDDFKLTASEMMSVTVTAPFKSVELTGFKSATSAAFTNILEIGFLSVAGWIVVSDFKSIAPFFFPLFTLFEWASGFAIGINRVMTERRIASVSTPGLTEICLTSLCWSCFFVMIYFGLFGLLLPIFWNTGLWLLGFAVIYVFFDGLQLIFRSLLVSQANGGSLMRLSFASYGVAAVCLGGAVVTKDPSLFFIALLMPLVIMSVLIPVMVDRKGVDNREVSN